MHEGTDGPPPSHTRALACRKKSMRWKRSDQQSRPYASRPAQLAGGRPSRGDSRSSNTTLSLYTSRLGAWSSSAGRSCQGCKGARRPLVSNHGGP